MTEKEQESSRKKRKRDSDDEKEEEKKAVIKKELKTEKYFTVGTSEAKKETISAKSNDAGKDPCEKNLDKQVSEKSKIFKPEAETVVTVNCQPMRIKKEPRDSPTEEVTQSSPGPSVTRSSSTRTLLEEALVSQSKTEDPSMTPPRGLDLTFSVEVKKEPKVESILIEDDDDDDDESGDSRLQNCSRVQHLSPVHSLWYKRPQSSRHHATSHQASHRERSPSKSYHSPHIMDAADPNQMALVVERNDCPVCGEVLYTRKELSSHLHTHRHGLRGSCSVCRANTLTLDALLLHLNAAHGPRLLPLATSVTSDSLLSQALMPALPYTPGPMSAIASLVSMAACQATPSSAFLGAGAGLGGGVSSLMEQIITYRGLLPCPICQLLCTSRQHLATHLALMHADHPSPRSSGEGALEDSGEELKSEGQADEEGEGSSNFSCFDCSMGFSTQAAFTQHCMLQHNTTSTVSQGSCSVCHRAFHTWKTLHAHYLAAHGITNFCDRCKMGFVSTADLKTHYDSTHSTDTRNLTYICDICNKGFYSQSQCSAHKRSHISEKSFACQVCGSAFFKRGDLSKHFRTVHAPNRVFACRFCGKRGTRMDNMRSHVKSHGKHMTRDEVLSFIEEVSPN